jgi:hypothetical protein
MRDTDLPKRWRERIERFTDERYGPDYKHRGSLGASDFPGGANVSVRFPDGSKANFRYAFFIEAPEWRRSPSSRSIADITSSQLATSGSNRSK